MTSGGGGFFNRFTPWGRGGMVPPGVTKAVPRAGMTITLASKVMEEEGEVPPLRTLRSMTLPTMTGIYTGKDNTPYIVHSAMLNTKPIGTLYSTRMALLPQTMTPGDLCPHLKLHGTSNKVRNYTQL